MNKPLAGFLFFFLFLSICQGQVFDLTLVIQGIEQSRGGNVRVGLFNTPDTFKSKTQPVFKTVLIPNDTIESFTFTQILSGLYAVALYHDENDDETLTTKKFGIPTEGVGFSGSLKSKLKPPDFEETAFTLLRDTTIHIRVNYPGKSKEID